MGCINVKAQTRNVIHLHNFLPERPDDVHDFVDVLAQSRCIGDICCVVNVVNPDGAKSIGLQTTALVLILNAGQLYFAMLLYQLVMNAMVASE